MMVDCMSNRNLGILKNWKMLPDQAIANPSYEVEALAAQRCYMAQCDLASVMQMTENRPGRIRRLNLTVPFTFRRLEGGLEGGAWRGASRGLQGAWPLWRLQKARRVLEGSFKGASRWRGLEGRLKGARRGAWRGLEGGLKKGAWRGLEGSLKGA